MGTTKDRNVMDLTEAEAIKKRWQEYTDELYKKDLHDPDNHDGVIFCVFLGFPDRSLGKESACSVGDLGLIPGLGDRLEKGKATYSIILPWRIP